MNFKKNCVSSANMTNFCKTFAKRLIPRNWKKEKKRKAWPSCDLILMPYQSRFLWLLKVFEAWCTRGITMKTHN
jgi:hypothetical protein